MDILTQGVLGAAVATTVAKPEETRRAGVIGFLSGLLADADILIRSSSDPLLMLEYHRHFTHSIFFVPLGAFIAAVLLWPFLKRRMAFSRLYIFSLLGYSLSGAIDTCTSYGTYLFWPLINERISLNIIAIVDPVFTTSLILALVLANYRQQPRPYVTLGLAFCSLYLVVALFLQARAQSLVQELASSRLHVIEKSVIKPTLGNLVLWRSTYMANGVIYTDGVRMGFWDKPEIIPGNSIPVFVPERDVPTLSKHTLLYQEIQRFAELSDGFIARHKDRDNILGDVRYGMLPTDIRPLWGIVINPARPDQHVKYDTFRDNSRETRKKFFNMLLGKHGT